MGILDRLRRRGDAPAEEPYAYPLDRTNDRVYPEGFTGDLFVWDIDKTYLVSEFDSFKGLLSIPFEFAIDKRNIAGTDTLLHAIRHGPGDASAQNPLYFISASPPQLRAVIARKMLLDGVEHDGICFKDQLAILRSRRIGRIRHQTGYKISGLLLNRRELPWGVREFLFGDDSESDALIYSLYADIVAGRLRGDDLRATLIGNHIEPEDADYIVSLAADLPSHDLVHGIYINLEKRSPPSRFAAWGERLVPCFDTFQMALHLYQSGLIRPTAVFNVGRDLLNRHNYRPVGLLRSALDLAERRRVSLETLVALWPELRAQELVPPFVTLDPSAQPQTAPKAEESRDFATPIDMVTLAKPR
jgi:hypothetical protein